MTVLYAFIFHLELTIYAYKGIFMELAEKPKDMTYRQKRKSDNTEKFGQYVEIYISILRNITATLFYLSIYWKTQCKVVPNIRALSKEKYVLNKLRKKWQWIYKSDKNGLLKFFFL